MRLKTIVIRSVCRPTSCRPAGVGAIAPGTPGHLGRIGPSRSDGAAGKKKFYERLIEERVGHSGDEVHNDAGGPQLFPVANVIFQELGEHAQRVPFAPLQAIQVALRPFRPQVLRSISASAASDSRMTSTTRVRSLRRSNADQR